MNNEQLKIYVFYCTNGLEKEQVERFCSGLKGMSVKAIGLPCSGKIDIPYLMKAFETGADGAVIVTCKRNECQHLEGNLRAQKRAQAVESLLEEIGMDRGRMALVMLKDDDAEGAVKEVRSFIDGIAKMATGPLRPRSEVSRFAENTRI